MPDDLRAAFAEASLEAEKAFGNAELYLEKCSERRTPHRDSRSWPTRTASVVHLGERECSIQRHHQKLVEESPLAGARAGASATSLGERAAASRVSFGYVNAGTLEFLRAADGSRCTSWR